MSTVRWGVLSTADIGMSKVTPAIQRAHNCEVVAIASRNADSAARAADQLGIPVSYGSYEQLLESEEVDAIYIPLPNNMHAEWTIRGAEAGKHILCEKPLAMSVAEIEEMERACQSAGVLLGEAFMYRHHPTWLEAVRLVSEGAIGELQAVQSWFSYFNDDPTNIRNKIENGGGALMDIGCYCISLSRLLFDSEPSVIKSTVRRDPVMSVDIVTSAILEFSGGRQAAFTCSTRSEDDQRVHIVGTTGRIDIEIPFNIPPDRPTRIFLTSGGESKTITFEPADAYTLQAEAFAAAIISDGPVAVPASDASANMAVIEAILASG